jgi:hypothetical protein
MFKNTRASQHMTTKNLNTFAFLALLLSADVGFIVLHLIHAYTPYLSSIDYSLETDRGYAEVFQYIKEYWIAGMLAVLFARTRQAVYCTWSLLFGYLLFDDAFQVHERVGRMLRKAGYFSDSPLTGLSAQDFGELTVSAFAGITFLVLIGSTYLLSTPDAKQVSKRLVALLGIIILFGVFVDMLHSAMESLPGSSILAVVEDGGEMLAVSITCYYVLGLLRIDRDFFSRLHLGLLT